MGELPSQTNSAIKAMIGIGTASVLSLCVMPNYLPKVPLEENSYSYECTSENQCFYQLKHETMQFLLNQNEMEPIIDVPVVKTIKVRFNKPKRIKFYSVEDGEGFLS